MMKIVKNLALAVMAFAAVACNDEGGKGGNKSPYSADITTPANCYIVAPGSTVRFVANIGNTAEKAVFTTAELTWQDVQGMVTKVDAQAAAGKVVVTLASGVEGNALVSVKDAEGKIVWNYHLWVTNYNPDENAMVYTYTRTITAEDGAETTEEFSYTMMDRYMGAMTAEAGAAGAHGLHYNWGRPAPLFAATAQDGSGYKAYYTIAGDTVANVLEAPVEVENNIANAIANPTTQYNAKSEGNYGWIANNRTIFKTNEIMDMWGGVSSTKTQYDPCPAGWRVAPAGAWKFLGGDANITASNLAAENAVAVIYKDGVEGNANILGRTYNIGGKNYYFPDCGESGPNGLYCYGAGTTYPKGKAWTATCDSENARAYGTEVSPSWIRYYSGLGVSYALPVRCVKVQ